ncbi:MAG: PQQ-dependent sugar dehydrogenase [Nodosilinea sp.]
MNTHWFRLLTPFAAGLTLAGCAVSTPNSGLAELGPEPTSAIPAQEAAQAAPARVVDVNPVTLVEGLEHPWSAVWLPNGDILITERPGRLRRVSNGVLEPTPIAGLPDVLALSQGGLLDITLHPRFENNGLVYLAYADGTQQANRTQVARARLEGDTLTDWTVIFTNNRDKSGGQHFGSRLLWLPDETLLVAIGDGGNPPLRLDGELIRAQAQNRQTLLGSVVRITDDGEAPDDNPFVNDSEANPLLWSYGHRNIQGLALDPITNQVWSTEHGSRGGDELNQLEPGKNYGWPVVTYSEEYSGGPVSSEQSRPGMVDPVTYWTPSIAPSGLAVYRGDRYPQWQGQLFAGGLVSKDVKRIELDAEGRVVSEASISIGQRVRTVTQGPDGFLYVLTDDPSGRLIRLDPAP